MIESNESKGIVIDDTLYQTKLTRKYSERKPYQPKNPLIVTAYIPALVADIFVKEGQMVSIGQELITLEAMKMKNSIKAEGNAKVKKIHAKLNTNVARNELLIELE